MEKKYKRLDMKISKLVRTQIRKLNINAQFYHRVINETNIPFSNEELMLLNKGLKNKLSHKPKHWLSNLAVGASWLVLLSFGSVTLPPTNYA